MTWYGRPAEAERSGIGRKTVRSALFCCLMSSVAATARAQEADQKVVVTVQVVSEGRASVTGASATVEDVSAVSESPTLVGRFAADGATISVRLEVGRDYRIRVEAPGHRGRATVVSPTGASTLRLVLSVDPYELPPILATAGAGDLDWPARSVFQADFANESLTYATVEEWLRDVPGATLRGRGPGGGQVLSVRGSRPEDVLVLLDGVPLNDPLTGRANLAMIPTSTLESGTLVHGTASQKIRIWSGSWSASSHVPDGSRLRSGRGSPGGVVWWNGP